VTSYGTPFEILYSTHTHDILISVVELIHEIVIEFDVYSVFKSASFRLAKLKESGVSSIKRVVTSKESFSHDHHHIVRTVLVVIDHDGAEVCLTLIISSILTVPPLAVNAHPFILYSPLVTSIEVSVFIPLTVIELEIYSVDISASLTSEKLKGSGIVSGVGGTHHSGGALL
jgi:hypothetical protein